MLFTYLTKRKDLIKYYIIKTQFGALMMEYKDEKYYWDLIKGFLKLVLINISLYFKYLQFTGGLF